MIDRTAFWMHVSSAGRRGVERSMILGAALFESRTSTATLAEGARAPGRAGGSTLSAHVRTASSERETLIRADRLSVLTAFSAVTIAVMLGAVRGEGTTGGASPYAGAGAPYACT